MRLNKLDTPCPCCGKTLVIKYEREWLCASCEITGTIVYEKDGWWLITKAINVEDLVNRKKFEYIHYRMFKEDIKNA